MYHGIDHIEKRNKSSEKRMAAVKKIVLQMEEYHRVNYGKIIDMNIQQKGLENGWSIEPIIEQFQEFLNNLGNKNDQILENLNKKKISIYLFGKVSAGKSRIVNAILGEDIMASAPSHTTSCFINITKTSNSNHCIRYPHKDDIWMESNMRIESVDNRQMVVEEISDIPQLKSRLKQLTVFDTSCKAILETNETLELHLNIPINKILKDDVELFDCPGAGNLKEITDSIEKHSSNADIFIFMMNHCLSEQEQEFFKSKSEEQYLDIFILINRWDETDFDDEEMVTKSMATITECCTQFLFKYQILNPSDRIYFISANESFMLEVKKIKPNDNAKKRTEDFGKFINTLSMYIDKNGRRKMQNSQSQNDKVNDRFKKRCHKFIQDICNLKNSSVVQNYENIKFNLSNFIDTIPGRCESKKTKLKEQIQIDIEEMKNSENISDKDRLNEQFRVYQKRWKKDLKLFQSNLAEELMEFMKKSSPDSLPFEFENSKLQFAEHDVTFGDLLVFVLSIVPVINWVAMGIHISLVIKRNRKKNIDLLESMKKDLFKSIEKTFNNIKDENETNATEMKSIYIKKIQLYDDYWKGLDGYIKKIQDVGDSN